MTEPVMFIREPLFSTNTAAREREFFVDNLLARIHFDIVIIRWTGLAPWEFEFPFPGSLTSTFLRKLLRWCFYYGLFDPTVK